MIILWGDDGFLREIARTKINRSYVTTVPRAVRSFLDLDWGDYIVWCVKGEEIIVRKGRLERRNERG